jgi:lysophospholipase L1-like esterase
VITGIGAILLLSVILTSTSTSGVILQRYSLRLAAFAAVLVGLVSSALAALLHAGVRKSLAAFFSSVPPWLASLSAVLPVPALFLIWFLFPFPLLERWNGLLGMCLILTAPVVFMFGSYTQPKLSEAVKSLVASLVILVPGVLLLEAATRLLVPGSIFSPKLALVTNQRFSLEIDLPGISPEGVLTTNRWGMRGEDPPADWNGMTTVITVGGSTTVCYYLDDSKTWPHIMQETLRQSGVPVWVGNAGIPCHSVSEHVLMLKEVVATVKPDLVVFLVGANELAHFWGGEAAVNRNPLQPQGLRDRLFGSSRVLQVLHKARIVMIDEAMVVRPAVTEEREIIRNRLRTPMTFPEPELPEDLFLLLPDPGAFSGDILRMIRICREIGATPVFLTQPLLFRDTVHWRGIQGATVADRYGAAYSAATVSLFLDALNLELLEICAREGVACFDLASAVSGESAYFYDEMHFTELGAERIGEEVAWYLLELGILTGD